MEDRECFLIIRPFDNVSREETLDMLHWLEENLNWKEWKIVDDGVEMYDYENVVLFKLAFAP